MIEADAVSHREVLVPISERLVAASSAGIGGSAVVTMLTRASIALADVDMSLRVHALGPSASNLIQIVAVGVVVVINCTS